MDDELLFGRCESWLAALATGHDAGHDISHLRRVVRNAQLIAHGEAYTDTRLIRLCALFHDVADHKFTTDPGPVLAGVTEFLRREGISARERSIIIMVAENVSFSKNKGNRPDSPELSIVMDADRLDAMGAVGIARAFTYGGFRNRPMYGSGLSGTTIGHFYDKLLLLKDLMNTATAKKMAQERHQYMVEFINRFERETGVEPATLSLGS